MDTSDSSKMILGRTMKTSLFLFFALLAISSASRDERHSEKDKSYACPPNFMRLSYKCYYFSNYTATWQDAYWKCSELRSNIATIKNGNQDKVVRRTLDQKGLAPKEWWVGGRYDWGTMSWKWAESGKSVQYNGFHEDFNLMHDKDSLLWNCIILDPAKQYRWNSRMCTESKYFICQSKIRTIGNKDRKKLQKRFRTDKHNKLNEVPVPEIQTNSIGTARKQYDKNILNKVSFAARPKEVTMYSRKNKKETQSLQFNNGTQADMPSRRGSKPRKLRKQKEGGGRRKHNKIMYKTYYEGTPSPYLPRVLVEEFSYS
ncbi:PREDICTED: uncharacterized protein LOC108557357 [Nicrophorus vespilloides]|uniref:Uncharacterized protein LOC108557357 n=1 Tax=Nicrophorus vespilloides TaxID=110193 RepID=A0ABM1M429_NICVS|nr:PREDICTED: uncharacterized protein LOC108557357 [Nicrophorus vespilloides]XP_017769329.1 PREDICTED: uncharacterized protein LOC108557357 [Nicrophorus vespilloides]